MAIVAERTKLSPVVKKDFGTPFNKSENYKKIAQTNYQLKDSIDRIQLSVKNREGYFSLVLDTFKLEFEYLGTKRKKKRFMYRFKYQEKKIQLFYHINQEKRYWFSISLHQPDKDIQLTIRNLLMEIVEDDSEVSVSQVEFAKDFYPDNKDEIFDLRSEIFPNLVLKYSRKNSYKIIYDKLRDTCTEYQGNKGNVRKGSKGLICYIKDKLGCVRVELRANKSFLKKNDISSLPISFDDIDFFDHIEYRQSLTESTINKLVKLICKQKYKSLPIKRDKRSKRRRRVHEEAIRATIFDESLLEPYAPVAAQINAFKKLKEEYGFTCPVSTFFPEIIY